MHLNQTVYDKKGRVRVGFFKKLFGQSESDQFADRFLQGLRQAGSQREFEYDKENFRFVSSGEEGYINLDNYYREYCELPKSERDQFLVSCISSVIESESALPEKFSDARSQLRVKIWRRDSIEELRRQTREEGEISIGIQFHEIGSHLYASVAYDTPNSVLSVNEETLEDWGVDFREALNVGIMNLSKENFSVVDTNSGPSGAGLHVISTGDSYDASRILLLDFIRQLSFTGQIIALAPNRDCLLLTGSDDLEGLEAMLEITFNTEDHPRPVSSLPLRLEGDHWVDWMPERSHPLFQRFNLLKLRYLVSEYNDQKERLDLEYEQQESSVFVATFSVIETVTDEIFSYSLWAKDSETLLPETNLIMFYIDGQEVVASCDWQRAMDLVGYLMVREDGMYPPRYRVVGFPTDEQLQEIGKLDFG